MLLSFVLTRNSESLCPISGIVSRSRGYGHTLMVLVFSAVKLGPISSVLTTTSFGLSVLIN